MKIVGSISTLDDLLVLLKKEAWHSSAFRYYFPAVLFSACLCSETRRD
jgi:hypothetical protein